METREVSKNAKNAKFEILTGAGPLGVAELKVGLRCLMSQDKWQTLYREAILETNFDKLVERVKMAEKAISERLSLDEEVSAEELRELQNSRNSLITLTEERKKSRTDLDGNK